MVSNKFLSSPGVTVLLVAFVLPVVMWAQMGRGRMTGVVKDPSGAVIPSANVTVMQQNTGIAFNVQTQANGTYLVPGLSPGDYSVSAEARGFKRVKIDGLKVDVDSTLTQDVVLEVGPVTESIEVTGQTSLVETTSGTVGTTVQMKHVLEIPLNDRNIFNLINLAPGAFLQHRYGPGATYLDQISLGGGRTWTQLTTLDGVSNTRGGLGPQNIELVPPVDSLQEFKVEVNNLSAEYGRGAGGTVTATTRSGTNQFHGTFYEYLRNDKFDAIVWGASTVPPLKRNNFGGVVGGPIRKNRMFFFFSYDGLRNVQGGAGNTRNVGLPEWRTGNFSTATRDAGGRAAVVPIYDPETGTGTFGAPRGTSPFPGNIIPTSRLDPVALKMMAYLPLPNRTPDNPFNQSGNWQETAPSTLRQDYYTGRVDHEVTSATKMFGRYSAAWPVHQWGVRPKSWPVGFATGFNPWVQQNFGLGVTHLFSPSFFLNALFGISRYNIGFIGADAYSGINYPQVLGLPNVPGPTPPRTDFSTGLVPMSVLGGGADNSNIYANQDYLADFTKVQGGHTLKFGGQHNRFNHNSWTNAYPGGNWGFDGHFTRGVDAAGNAVANTGISMADFLLGRVNSVALTIQPSLGRRSQYYGAYFQDDWKATSRLTLNIGMRWDTQNPVYSVDGRMSNFDPYQVSPLAGTGDIPAGALGVTTFVNKNGRGKYLWAWRKNSFMPRFGFAYRLFGTNETVLRGGYGVFYGLSMTAMAGQAGTLGFIQSYSMSNPVPFRFRDGIPAGGLLPPPQSELTPAFGQRGTAFQQSSMSYYDPYRAIPYNQNVNLTVQHQWKGILFEVGYLGNLSRNVPASGNRNLIPPQLLSRTDIAERLKRPFTIFAGNQASVSENERSQFFSNYHAFTFKTERRFRNGFAWTISYSHSKWIDNAAFVGGNNATLTNNNGPQNIYDARNERSRSTNDIPHRLVFAPVVELPFGKGRRWLNQGGALNTLVGGWQVSTMGTLQSGSPFGATVLNGGQVLLGDAAGSLRPDLLRDPNSAKQGQPAEGGVRGIQWLDAAAFTNPARYTYGTSSRTLPGVTGPGMVRFDVMLAKGFAFGDRWRAQFRWEMQDAFNTPQFVIPAASFGGGNFGVSTSVDAFSYRVMQFGLKLYW